MNEVTNFMYYIFNRWSMEEAKHLFGGSLGEHIYQKWYDKCPNHLLWYSELDEECKQSWLTGLTKSTENERRLQT